MLALLGVTVGETKKPEVSKSIFEHSAKNINRASFSY